MPDIKKEFGYSAGVPPKDAAAKVALEQLQRERQKQAETVPPSDTPGAVSENVPNGDLREVATQGQTGCEPSREPKDTPVQRFHRILKAGQPTHH